MLFLPQDKKECDKARKLVNEVASQEAVKILGWRQVPVNPDSLGDMAREAMPSIWQVFVSVERITGDELERRLYLLRTYSMMS